MSTAAKKQKNREYYLKNREKILSRARERKVYPSQRVDRSFQLFSQKY